MSAFYYYHHHPLESVYREVPGIDFCSYSHETVTPVLSRTEELVIQSI